MSFVRKVFQKEVGDSSGSAPLPTIGDVMVDVMCTAVVLGGIWCAMNPDKVSNFVSDRFNSSQVEELGVMTSTVQTLKLG